MKQLIWEWSDSFDINMWSRDLVCQSHLIWRQVIAMMSILPPLMASGAVDMTTCGTTNKYKVGTMTTHGFHSVNPMKTGFVWPLTQQIQMEFEISNFPVDFLWLFAEVSLVKSPSGNCNWWLVNIGSGNGRADSRFALSQWETALLCNDVSHWPGANLESALNGMVS